jgi:hypothetical protein
MVTAFLSALVVTLIVGAIARFLAASFTTDSSARVVGFCVALGFSLGRFSYRGPATMQAAIAVSAIVGAVAALAVLWVWLLRKSDGELSAGNG